MSPDPFFPPLPPFLHMRTKSNHKGSGDETSDTTERFERTETKDRVKTERGKNLDTMARRRQGESVQRQHPIAVRRRWRFLTCHNLIHSTVLYTLLLLAIAVVLGNYRLAPLGKNLSNLDVCVVSGIFGQQLYMLAS